MAASVAIVVSGYGGWAQADPNDHDQSLENRIDDLEKQLREVELSKAQLEARLKHLEASLATLVPEGRRQSGTRSPPTHNMAAASGTPASRTAASRTPASRTAARKPAAQTASAEPASGTAIPSGGVPASPQSAPAVQVASASPTASTPEPAKPDAVGSDTAGDTDNAPQEMNVLRDNSVTLKPSSFELSTELDYLRNENNLQSDRAILTSTTLRYGLFKWLELSANIPAGYSVRTTNVGPSQSATQRVEGIGDVSFQANARVYDQTVNWPGIVVSLGFITPTGPTPYNFTGYSFNSKFGVPTPNPRNPLAYYFSQGTWGIHSNIQFYKTVDPLILFFGFGPDHLFPVTQGGYTISGYNRFNYNMGFSFALSEKTTLGFSLTGSYYPDLKVDGRDVFQSSGEPTVVRLSLIQRIMKGVYLEPSASFGLDQDSPDFILGLGFRARL